jgi:hypothetical protein
MFAFLMTLSAPPLGKPEFEEDLSRQSIPLKDIRALVHQLVGTGIGPKQSEL